MEGDIEGGYRENERRGGIYSDTMRGNRERNRSKESDTETNNEDIDKGWKR